MPAIEIPKQMAPDPEDRSNPAEPEEKQLCANCMLPNHAEAHFCAKCGAPLTSYASTGPFERLFAEGHVYRQATEQPRKFIVVFGIWLIFGTVGLAGGFIIAFDLDLGFKFSAIGALFVAFSVFMIWKTTRNYFVNRRAQASSTEKSDC